LVADLDIPGAERGEELLRHLTLHPDRDYQPIALKAAIT
jgi:hypothetical protein